jgi:hypothetical protein
MRYYYAFTLRDGEMIAKYDDASHWDFTNYSSFLCYLESLAHVDLID